MIGFSLDAFYALDLSAANPEHIHSVILFYGTQGDWLSDYSKSQAANLGHFAESDHFEPKSDVDELEELLKCAGRPITFYRYASTGHWFMEPDHGDVYNPA